MVSHQHRSHAVVAHIPARLFDRSMGARRNTRIDGRLGRQFSVGVRGQSIRLAAVEPFVAPAAVPDQTRRGAMKRYRVNVGGHTYDVEIEDAFVGTARNDNSPASFHLV